MPETTRRVVDLAKRAARLAGDGTLEGGHFLIGILADETARSVLEQEYLAGETAVIPDELAAEIRRVPAAGTVGDAIPLGASIKAPFQAAYQRAGGLPPVRDLVPIVMAVDTPRIRRFLAANPRIRPQGSEAPARPRSRLGKLTEEVNALQNALARKVIGQRRAIQQIADAVFQARVYGRDNVDTPKAMLLFLGPPGVGKTYTAQLIAENLFGDREGSFLRLDMSSYADRDSYRMLVGFEPSYQGARPGLLTEHVKNHPECLILVDEVEKASTTVHNLFLQILDRGQLEDKNLRENVTFGDTIVVFTTNLGKDLYSRKQMPGFLNAPVESREVLDALRSARDMTTGLPALSPELCSRLAKGYPILFGHLTPLDLERIASLALDELAAEFESRLGTRITVADERFTTLAVLRLGPDLDARTVTAGVPLMIKDAFRTVLNERREELFSDPLTFERVRTLALELPPGGEREVIDAMHEGGRRLLVISQRPLADLGRAHAPELSWSTVPCGADAVEALRREAHDAVLLDLELGAAGDVAEGTVALRELRRLRAAFPDVPVYLYADRVPTAEKQPPLAERLAASGGAQGFIEGPVSAWEPGERSPLEKLRRAVVRDRFLREAFRTRQTAQFDWYNRLRFDDKEGTITLCPRDLHLRTVVASSDRAARLTFTGIPAERLDDVAGAREAKRRLREIIGWMRNPEPLRSLGLGVPAGILLEGPPGNGKTLLARATAGEANLPFFAVAATDFASKWVGESEGNIRELFERAATYAPSMVFIDEIDAIGGRRSGESRGINDAMLNQLLVSMDGFTAHDRPVFFLAATNRADILDPALKRPGRFDLIITIDDLDVEARRELLTLKSKRLPLAAGVDLDAVARASTGMSGAQLAQVVKEAAVLALRRAGAEAGPGEIEIAQDDLREALTNVRYGLRREGPLPSETEIRRTAYHEAGHALVAELVNPGTVHQATVLPRGRALGFVESVPHEEYSSFTVNELCGRMRVALAGRGAELLVYGEDGISAGCSQDLEVATRLAALAVTRYGMSSQTGPVSFAVLEDLVPSATAADRVHEEITRLVRREESAVTGLLNTRRRALEALTEELVEHETVDGRRIAELVTVTEE